MGQKVGATGQDVVRLGPTAARRSIEAATVPPVTNMGSVPMNGVGVVLVGAGFAGFEAV
jgi:hypothetical protein